MTLTKSAASMERVVLIGLLMLANCVGCASTLMRGQSPDVEELPEIANEQTKSPRLVGDVAHTWAGGMRFQKVESVALVTGLKNTGSDPQPGPQRDALMAEMQTHDVKDPNQLLASPTTSLVLVRGWLPPAVQKGDRFDIEALIPSRSETTSLRDGWLMQSRLREMEVLGGAVRSGHILAQAEGDVLVDAVFKESEDPVLLTRGRVLGGGISQTSRSLGLVVKSENSSVAISSQIGAAINSRFHTFDHGKKTGVATPKRDNFIEIAVHPRYKQNVWRYMKVLRSIALRETPSQKLARLTTLEQKLLEPTTAADAAIELEAVGREGVSILKKGLQSADPAVRFYAAESLAYMEDSSATGPLTDAAANIPAFRWSALTALTAMDHISAYDGLVELLHSTSAEARYGAVRAIRQKNPRDPLVKGEAAGKSFSLVVVSTTGEPLLHFAKSHQPEIVIFGADQTMRPPKFLFAGPKIIIKGISEQQIKVTRFEPGQEDKSEICTNRLADLIPALARMGARYADVMQAMQEAKKNGDLDARIAIDALPRPDRVYRPEEPGDEGSADQVRSHTEADSTRLVGGDSAESAEKQANKGFFGRMTSWMR